MSTSSFTIGRHLVEHEKKFPEATGVFTALLWDLTIAFKIISHEVNKAGLVDILGWTGNRNVHGEKVRKLDRFAHDTIFSILRKKTEGPDGTLEDCLQPGVEQVAAGYCVYGSSTIMVYTAGQGVHGFTLDPTIGEFLLSHPDIQTPPRGNIYSINEGYSETWDEPTSRYIQHLKGSETRGGKGYSMRYIGSLVADVHRNLLVGGVFLYPATYKDPQNPKAKLRLLYEANPLAFVVEQAGGKASTGRQRIMGIQPESLHQRVPLVIGSSEEVDLYLEFMEGGKS